MRKNNTCQLILLALGLSLGGCKKQLNVFPTTAEVDGNLITDQQSARVALNGVYYRFADAGTDYNGTLATFWTDVNENIPSELSGSATYGYGPSAIDIGNLSPLDPYVAFIWNYCYPLVNAANGFLKNATPAGGIPAAAKKQMLAEARFLRAFGNSELLLYYGQYNDPSSRYGIILRDTFVNSTNLYTPRSNVAAAYTSILSDLDAAIDGLPVSNTTIYYANASAAKLLKARVLMNRGAAGDYAAVIGLTNDIITNGPFALEDSLKDIFLSKGFDSKEVILGIQPYPKETYKYEKFQEETLYIVSDSLAGLLADDARNQWVYYSVYDPYSNGYINQMTKYYSGDPVNLEPTTLSAYSYAFRVSEAYLLEAEAITLSTGDLASAKALLTTVMSHAGAGVSEFAAVTAAATPDVLQLEIVKENLRNFAFENGVDWFALRRLPFATLQRINPNIKDVTKLILPVPAAELVDNNVIQNPGY